MCRTCTPPTLEHVLYDEVGLGDHHEQGHVRPGEQRELRMASRPIEKVKHAYCREKYIFVLIHRIFT